MDLVEIVDVELGAGDLRQVLDQLLSNHGYQCLKRYGGGRGGG